VTEFANEFNPDRIDGSLLNQTDVAEVARRVVENGAVVGVNNASVWALAGDADHPDFGNRLYFDIKQRSGNKAVGTFLRSVYFRDLIDFDRIPDSVKPLLEDPDTLEATLGDLSFLRVPARQQKVDAMSDHLRRYVISQAFEDGQRVSYVQGYFAAAPTPFLNFEQALVAQGAGFPAISSMNFSGKPEIVSDDEAAAFSAHHDIDSLSGVGEPNPLSYGSYPILAVTAGGLECVRRGNISKAIMERVLAPLCSFRDADDIMETKPFTRRLEESDIPEIMSQDLYGAEARLAVIQQRLDFEAAIK